MFFHGEETLSQLYIFFPDGLYLLFTSVLMCYRILLESEVCLSPSQVICQHEVSKMHHYSSTEKKKLKNPPKFRYDTFIGSSSKVISSLLDTIRSVSGLGNESDLHWKAYDFFCKFEDYMNALYF